MSTAKAQEAFSAVAAQWADQYSELAVAMGQSSPADRENRRCDVSGLDALFLFWKLFPPAL